MKRSKALAAIGLALACLLAAGWSLGAVASEAKAPPKGKEMKLLKGDLWQRMTPNSKVAFVWGMGHVVEIEQELMARYPQLKRESFVLKVLEGMADVPMSTVVSEVDAFYAANPDKLSTPVVQVIWDKLIKPNLKTGIAGRPLN